MSHTRDPLPNQTKSKDVKDTERLYLGYHLVNCDLRAYLHAITYCGLLLSMDASIAGQSMEHRISAPKSTKRRSEHQASGVVRCLERIQTPHIPDRLVNHAWRPFCARHLTGNALPFVTWKN